MAVGEGGKRRWAFAYYGKYIHHIIGRHIDRQIYTETSTIHKQTKYEKRQIK